MFRLLKRYLSYRILDNIRDSRESETQITRRDIITRKDICNIKKSYNIDLRDGCRHKEDVFSVDIWIKEVENEENNPVIFYKKQNEISDDNNLLLESDFCLILMNNLQAKMLQKFGSNIVCIDNTHGLNMYDFELTTLMILDEFGEGFPVATMFSNRKDTFINELFFTKIRSKVGIINSQTFMTDITNTYFNAWTSIMGPIESRLYCSWHVDRAWQNNLAKVKDSEKRKWVYKTLKYLQRHMNVTKFEEEYSSFIQILISEQNTIEMGSYLVENYSNCKKQWAYCYRKQCGISTNMPLENMHKNLKYTYLEGKRVKRLDKSLHALLKLIRDKTTDRLIKMTKGKATKHSQQIHAEHRLAALTENRNTRVSENKKQFIVTWPNNKDHYVTKRTNEPPCCNLKCVYCNVCIHTFECTCIAFNIRSIICKHIHSVCLDNFEIEACGVTNKIENENELHELIDNHFHALKKPTQEKMKEVIQSNLTEVISNLNQELTDEQLEYLLKTSKNMKALVELKAVHNEMDEKFIIPDMRKNQEPHYKNIKKQTFFSTKKKRTSKMKGNKKPDEEEERIIKETLLELPITSRDNIEDHNYF